MQLHCLFPLLYQKLCPNATPNWSTERSQHTPTHSSRHPLKRTAGGSHVCPSDILHTCLQLHANTHATQTPTVIPWLQSETCKIITSDLWWRTLLYTTRIETSQRAQRKLSRAATDILIHSNIVWLSAGRSSSPYWWATISLMDRMAKLMDRKSSSNVHQMLWVTVEQSLRDTQWMAWGSVTRQSINQSLVDKHLWQGNSVRLMLGLKKLLLLVCL